MLSAAYLGVIPTRAKMEILDQDKLVLFIAFVVPGFIAIKCYELLSPYLRGNASQQVIDAVAYSCINYAAMFTPMYFVEAQNLQSTSPLAYSLFYAYVLLGNPVLLVVVWFTVRQSDLVQRFMPHPTQKAWDYVFGKRRAYWVIVNLKDGTKIGGMYGPDSFASSAPAEEQIFLEEQWVLSEEGGFDRPVEQTSGIMILGSEIRSIEFMHSGEDDDG